MRSVLCPARAGGELARPRRLHAGAARQERVEGGEHVVSGGSSHERLLCGGRGGSGVPLSAGTCVPRKGTPARVSGSRPTDSDMRFFGYNPLQTQVLYT